MNCLINGQPAQTLSPLDRGLAYGDGVFRTLRCEGGRIPFWGRHYAKLNADCTALGIACPSEQSWLADLRQLAPQDATLKLTVTRGIAGRGYACAAHTEPSRITACALLPTYPPQWIEQGVQVRWCDWLLSIQPGLAGIKHLNRLDQVMARREWQQAEIYDGLMCNARGEVVEGVISNLLLLRDGAMYSHPLHDCGVAGVARSVLFELLQRRGIALHLQAFDRRALLEADALLLCNSLAGPLQVQACGERSWPKSSFCSSLQQDYFALARQEMLDLHIFA